MTHFHEYGNELLCSVIRRGFLGQKILLAPKEGLYSQKLVLTAILIYITPVPVAARSKA